MNKERILHLADVIENYEIEDLGFNMNYEYTRYSPNSVDITGRGCGTVACIMGWAATLAEPNTNWHMNFRDIYRTAINYLGIDDGIARSLFYPLYLSMFEQILPKEAAITLRKLAETGVVDWSHVYDQG